MTEKEIQALQEANAKFEAENADLKKQLAETQALTAKQSRQHADHLANVANAVKHGGTVIVNPLHEVPGTFAAKWKDPQSGDAKSRKVAFQDGQTKVRMKDGQLVSSQGLIELANGKELSEDILKAFPDMGGITKEQAAARLTELAAMDYPLLK